ncbi:MAG: hypothetical protein ACXWXZ_12200 [Candidatus Binatia bacterium]
MTDHVSADGKPARMSWALPLQRFFDIDVEGYPNCGDDLKIIACPEQRRRAAIDDPPVIDRYKSAFFSAKKRKRKEKELTALAVLR